MDRVAHVIKAISFDGDDTLWTFEESMVAAVDATLNELARLAGLDSPPISVEETRVIRDRVADERGPIGPDNTLNYIRLLSWIEVANRAERGDLGEALTEFYFKAKAEFGVMLPDAERVVNELRCDYTVGVLTNGNSTPARYGSDLELDFLVAAEQFGIEKPSRRIFEIAAEQAGCEVTEMMHVGDSLETDVAGANAAGAVSVWLNWSGDRNDGEITPDYEIRGLAEVPGLVERLNAPA